MKEWQNIWQKVKNFTIYFILFYNFMRISVFYLWKVKQLKNVCIPWSAIRQNIVCCPKSTARWWGFPESVAFLSAHHEPLESKKKKGRKRKRTIVLFSPPLFLKEGWGGFRWKVQESTNEILNIKNKAMGYAHPTEKGR